MRDMLLKAVNVARDADFMEINAIATNSTSFTLKDMKPFNIRSGNLAGFGVRILRKNCWGFAASNDLADLGQCISSAVKMAKASRRRSIEAILSDERPLKKDVIAKARYDPRDIGIEEKIARCKELERAGKVSAKIFTTSSTYADSVLDNYYVNSDGANLYYNTFMTMCAFSAYIRDKGSVLSVQEKAAERSGFELLEGKDELFRKAGERCVMLLKSSLPPHGKLPVVVDQKMAGVMAHEALGHACEADSVLTNRSILKGKLGQPIAAPNVTVVDDATLPRLFGSYVFDAEGLQAKRTVLVEDGVLKNYLHCRETAAKSKTTSTANARQQSPESFPLVRMSNTFFEKGEMKFEELLEGIKYGVYVCGMKGGVTEPIDGSFQFAAEHGMLIENGKLTKPLRDITLVGNILTTLKEIDGIGNDIKLGSAGMCGKAGQMVPVSDGGPHMRIKEMLVGG